MGFLRFFLELGEGWGGRRPEEGVTVRGGLPPPVILGAVGRAAFRRRVRSWGWHLPAGSLQLWRHQQCCGEAVTAWGTCVFDLFPWRLLLWLPEGYSAVGLEPRPMLAGVGRARRVPSFPCSWAWGHLPVKPSKPGVCGPRNHTDLPASQGPHAVAVPWSQAWIITPGLLWQRHWLLANNTGGNTSKF